MKRFENWSAADMAFRDPGSGRVDPGQVVLALIALASLVATVVMMCVWGLP